MPRVLRDLLQASRSGLADGVRHAWTMAAVAPGTWVSVDPRRFTHGEQGGRIKALLFRAQHAHLDVHMGFARGAHAIAIGRRVIVVAEPMPDTLAIAAKGRQLRDIVDGPFLDDPAITIVKVIHRAGEKTVDLRCRCPSHVMRLDAPAGTGR